MNFTNDDLKAQMTPEHKATVDEAISRLKQAIQDLRQLGMVTTVETVPKLPLAMGHYGLRVSIRPDRDLTKFLTALAQDAYEVAAQAERE